MFHHTSSCLLVIMNRAEKTKQSNPQFTFAEEEKICCISNVPHHRHKSQKQQDEKKKDYIAAFYFIRIVFKTHLFPS